MRFSFPCLFLVVALAVATTTTTIADAATLEVNHENKASTPAARRGGLRRSGGASPNLLVSSLDQEIKDHSNSNDENEDDLDDLSYSDLMNDDQEEDEEEKEEEELTDDSAADDDDYDYEDYDTTIDDDNEHKVKEETDSKNRHGIIPVFHDKIPSAVAKNDAFQKELATIVIPNQQSERESDEEDYEEENIVDNVADEPLSSGKTYTDTESDSEDNIVDIPEEPVWDQSKTTKERTRVGETSAEKSASEDNIVDLVDEIGSTSASEDNIVDLLVLPVDVRIA